MSNNVAPGSPHGWIVMDKPLGLTSSQAVGVVKRLARAAGWGKVKVGHGGTLDPLATGVLPIALGEATKLTGRMLDADKAYEFTVAFGTATATDDAEGAVVATSPIRPTLAALLAALPAFTGAIRQRPPAHSALKVNGRRAYALARAGEAVELAEREVVVRALTVQHPPSESPPPCGEGLGGGVPPEPASAFVNSPTPNPSPQGVGEPAAHATESPPLQGEGWGGEISAATLAVLCSKGTYIRSLARDLAHALGTVGHVTHLRRTRAGPFALSQAHTVDNLQALCDAASFGEALLSLTAGLDGIPALAVDGREAAWLRQGARLPPRSGLHGLHAAFRGTTLIALVRADADGVAVERGFNLSDAAE